MPKLRDLMWKNAALLTPKSTEPFKEEEEPTELTEESHVSRTRLILTAFLSSHCHFEMFVSEKLENVKKGKDDKSSVRLTKKQAARSRLTIGSKA
jgi:hypothetical protein